MTTEEILKQLFLKGEFHDSDDAETKTSINKLIEVKYIRSKGSVWVLNTEVTDKILYPNAGKPICGYCHRQGNMSCFSPYCGAFCDSACLVQHTRRCRACAISIAMED